MDFTELRGAPHLSLGKGHVVTMGSWSLSPNPASPPTVASVINHQLLTQGLRFSDFTVTREMW